MTEQELAQHDAEIRAQVLDDLAAHFDKPYVLWSSAGNVIVSHLEEREHTTRLVDWLQTDEALDIASGFTID